MFPGLYWRRVLPSWDGRPKPGEIAFVGLPAVVRTGLIDDCRIAIVDFRSALRQRETARATFSNQQSLFDNHQSIAVNSLLPNSFAK